MLVMLFLVQPLEMEYSNKKLSFWCKILTQMKNAMFYRKESREPYSDQFLQHYF